MVQWTILRQCELVCHLIGYFAYTLWIYGLQILDGIFYMIGLVFMSMDYSVCVANCCSESGPKYFCVKNIKKTVNCDKWDYYRSKSHKTQ